VIQVSFKEFRWQLLGAIMMAILGTYLLAAVNFYYHDLIHLRVALIITGPMIMMNGWFIKFMRPTSKLGHLTINYGFNFACGWLLQAFHPLNPSFSQWTSNGFVLLFMLLMITCNSWMTFHQLHLSFKHAKLWNRVPDSDSTLPFDRTGH